MARKPTTPTTDQTDTPPAPQGAAPAQAAAQATGAAGAPAGLPEAPDPGRVWFDVGPAAPADATLSWHDGTRIVTEPLKAGGSLQLPAGAAANAAALGWGAVRQTQPAVPPGTPPGALLPRGGAGAPAGAAGASAADVAPAGQAGAGAAPKAGRARTARKRSK